MNYYIFDEQTPLLSKPPLLKDGIVITIHMNETVMNNFIERVDPDILINFEDEAACIEFLYMVYSVNQYGAFVDVDSADLLSIFQAYQRDKNQEGSEQYPA